MAKRKAKHASSSHNFSAQRLLPDAVKGQAAELIEAGQVEEALALLEPFAAFAPRDSELQLLLGIGYSAAGEPDLALVQYEQAYARTKDPVLLYPLGLTYLELAMVGSALYTLDEAERRGMIPPDDMADVMPHLRDTVGEIAKQLGMPLDKTIAGLRELERGARMTDRDDFVRAIEVTRAAIRLLGDWPPAQSQLAYNLFYDGQIAAAIAECRQFLTRQPGDLQAAAQLIRLLAWAGDRTAAEAEWQALSTRAPINLPKDAPMDAIMVAIALAQAAAAIDDDASVQRLLQPLVASSADENSDQTTSLQIQRFLATAEANLGSPQPAKARLQPLKDADGHCNALYEALEAGKTGLGLLPRFAYYVSSDVLPMATFDKLYAALEAQAHGDDPRAEKDIRKLVARYPQLVHALEISIWDEGDVELNLIALRFVGSPAAHAALRRFAGSQAGRYEQRILALLNLQLSGGAQPGETFSIWRNDAWHAVPLRNFTVEFRPSPVRHKDKAMKLIEQAAIAADDGQLDQAASLLRKVVELEPHAYDALCDLASIVAVTGDKTASAAMLERVLELNPLYVAARVQLALNVVEQDTAAAAAYLQPLETVTTFEPLEFASYQFALATLAIYGLDFDAARDALTMALYIDPNYTSAIDGLAILDEQEAKANKPRSRWNPFKWR